MRFYFFGKRGFFASFHHRFLFLLSCRENFANCVWFGRCVCVLFVPPTGFRFFLRGITQKANGEEVQESVCVRVSMRGEGAICGVLLVFFHVFIAEFEFDIRAHPNILCFTCKKPQKLRYAQTGRDCFFPWRYRWDEVGFEFSPMRLDAPSLWPSFNGGPFCFCSRIAVTAIRRYR